MSERVIIGGLLAYPGWMKHVYDVVRPVDFIDFDSRLLARTIWARYERTGVFDHAAVFRDILEHPRIAQNIKDNMTIMIDSIWPPNWEGPIEPMMRQHATYLHAAAREEKVWELGEILKRATEQPTDTETRKIVKDTLAEIRELEQPIETQDSMSVKSLADSLINDIKHPDTNTDSLLTGLKSLDNITGGLYKGEMVILAGRPVVGKTSLALNITLHCLRQGKPVAFVSLDTAAKKVVNGLAIILAQVNTLDVRRKILGVAKRERYIDALTAIAEMPLYVLQSLNTVGAIDRALGRMPKLSLLIIDHAQKMVDENYSQYGRTQEMTAISRNLSRLTQHWNIPLLVLSQLRRLQGDSAIKRPRLEDLRESGGLEQDSDVVLFLYRISEKERLPKGVRPKRLRRLYLAKHREAPETTRLLSFKPECLTFSVFSKGEDNEQQDGDGAVDVGASRRHQRRDAQPLFQGTQDTDEGAADGAEHPKQNNLSADERDGDDAPRFKQSPEELADIDKLLTPTGQEKPKGEGWTDPKRVHKLAEGE